MPSYRIKRDAEGRPFVFVRLKGRSMLRHATYNKGSAFTQEERRQFRLEGLLPSAVSSAEDQLLRAYAHVRHRTDLLDQYYALTALQERNETLFYRLILEHLEEFAPIVYTPIAALACDQFNHTFRLGRGMWITPEHSGRIDRVLCNSRFQDVRLVVVTDNSRCFGLGDKGAGGICLPIGKSVLYTVAAGIHPTRILPISLDVGTDNRRLLDDPLYLGWRHRRLRGDEYDQLVDEFVTAVKERFPRALLQWEDLSKGAAFRLLDRYRDQLASFSDDIQGTAAVVLAGILSAAHLTGRSLKEQRIVICGAGAAGVGIGRLLRVALARAGLRGADVTRAVALVDSGGLLVEGRAGDENPKKPLLWPTEFAAEAELQGESGADLLSIVKQLEPTVLIGASGQRGAFSEEVLRAMAARCPRPLVLIVSNPTSKAEASPEDVVRWTDGKALLAMWSHGATVGHGEQEVLVSHGHNILVAPGVALGAMVADASCVSDSMFVAAAHALSAAVPRDAADRGALYPSMSKLRAISRQLALAVAREALAEGVAASCDEDALAGRIDEVWSPRYVEFRHG